eukprot:UC1_evm1s165
MASSSSLSAAKVSADAELHAWAASLLNDILGFDAGVDMAEYVCSMRERDDLLGYLGELLGGITHNVTYFVDELLRRKAAVAAKFALPPGVKAYRKKELESDAQRHEERRAQLKREKREAAQAKHAIASATAAEATVSAEEIDLAIIKSSSAAAAGATTATVSTTMGHGKTRQKQKFVPLSAETLASGGLSRMLPGRRECDCQARHHPLINNCLACGRIVCEQEGSGPCVFCGTLVASPAEQEILARDSRQSKKLLEKLLGGAHSLQPQDVEKMRKAALAGGGSGSGGEYSIGLKKALATRDRLVQNDRSSAKLSRVIDDESDYFTTEGNSWLSGAERDKLGAAASRLRDKQRAARKTRTITIDFAGRRVIEEAPEQVDLYDAEAARDAMEQAQAAGLKNAHSGGAIATTTSTAGTRPLDAQPEGVHGPVFAQGQRPQFVPSGRGGGSTTTATKTMATTTAASAGAAAFSARSGSRLQDAELEIMRDTGQCMSMHQPWAGLLVRGIKMHEGRTWYTPHRGRLWIAATVQKPDDDFIAEMVDTYTRVNPRYNFPETYPTACLLGYVDVEDCLAQEDYRAKFPDGLSASPYVLICTNPHELVVRQPMKGKHKIYALDGTVHAMAKAGAIPAPTIAN